MRKSTGFIPHIAVIFFVCIVLGTALYSKHPFAVYALVTESSAGTWVSSMLLVTGATISLIISSLGKKRTLWLILTVMLFSLAADERFMIHEYLKKMILFNIFEGDWKRMGRIDEMPVVLASISGSMLSFWLFRIRQSAVRRVLLAFVVFSGAVSVIFDVFRINPVAEEICKHAAELMLVIWLLEMHRGSREKNMSLTQSAQRTQSQERRGEKIKVLEEEDDK